MSDHKRDCPCLDCMTPRRPGNSRLVFNRETRTIDAMYPNGLPRSEAHIQYLAQWMIDRGFATGHGDTFTDLLEQLSWQIYELRAIEREACAVAAEQYTENGDGTRPCMSQAETAEMIAADIRKRHP